MKKKLAETIVFKPRLSVDGAGLVRERDRKTKPKGNGAGSICLVKWIRQNTWCYQSRFPTLIRSRSRRLGEAEDGARLSSRQWNPGPKPEAGIVRECTFKDLGKEGVYFTSGGIEVICGQRIDCRDCHKFFNTSFLERCDMYSVALLLEFWPVLSLPWSLQYHRSDVMPVFTPNS